MACPPISYACVHTHSTRWHEACMLLEAQRTSVPSGVIAPREQMETKRVEGQNCPQQHWSSAHVGDAGAACCMGPAAWASPGGRKKN